MEIGGKEGGVEAHRDEVIIEDGVRGGVSGNIDCHQSISFADGAGIKAEKLIPVDWHGSCLEWRRPLLI